MCTVCGCGSGETKVDGHAHGVIRDGEAAAHDHHHEHVHDDGTVHAHAHEHPDHGSRITDHDHLHVDNGPAHTHAPGMAQNRMVRIERDILDMNNAFARRNRRRFEEHGIFTLNLVSSPGSGKTTLLVETIRRLRGEMAVAVIEGDQQTSFDAERIRATGTRAVQINTGKGCHLDASMVEHALDHLSPADDSLLLIENVGNLVCPSAFDLGEAHKVIVLSVTEGEDKPLKYPDIFAASRLMLLNKVDLLPHLSFDTARAIEFARRVSPDIAVMPLSATQGSGFEAWLDWLRAGVRHARALRQLHLAAAARRAAELEALVGRLD